MSSPVQVGVTGGIGSGKSVVCRIFRVLSIPVYDADSRAKWLMSNHPELIEGVKELFGKEAYSDGQLNRQHIARKTFHDAAILSKLNQLVHPAVGRDYAHWYRKQDAPYVIKEAALLIETGSYETLDYLINVYAPEALRIQRVLQRDPQRSRSQVEEIISSQTDDDTRKRLADFTIVNDESQLLIHQVLKLDKIFRQ